MCNCYTFFPIKTIGFILDDIFIVLARKNISISQLAVCTYTNTRTHKEANGIHTFQMNLINIKLNLILFSSWWTSIPNEYFLPRSLYRPPTQFDADKLTDFQKLQIFSCVCVVNLILKICIFRYSWRQMNCIAYITRVVVPGLKSSAREFCLLTKQTMQNKDGLFRIFFRASSLIKCSWISLFAECVYVCKPIHSIQTYYV